MPSSSTLLMLNECLIFAPSRRILKPPLPEEEGLAGVLGVDSLDRERRATGSCSWLWLVGEGSSLNMVPPLLMSSSAVRGLSRS